MQENEVGYHFISSYYTSLAYNPDDIKKYYDNDANIWRSTMNTQVGKKLSEASNELVIKIPTGCEIVMTGYNILPLNGQILINTNGYILNENETELFNQTFVLAEKAAKRYFIIADSFNINNAQKAVNTTAETFVAPKNDKQKKQGKFAPYSSK